MKWKVLIVDDDRNFRYAMRDVIPWEENGFEVAGEAVHGKQALEILKEKEIHIILTDMEMPVMNGVELTEAVKKEFPDLIIVALSAFDDFEFVKESMRLGAEDYILKQDFDGEKIIEILKKLCEKRIEKRKEMFSGTKVQARFLDYLCGRTAVISADQEWMKKQNMTLCLVNSNSEFTFSGEREEGEHLLFFMKAEERKWLFLFQMPVTPLKSAEAEFWRLVVSELQSGFSGHCQVGICDCSGRFDALPEMYSKADISLQYHMYFPERQIFHYLDIRKYEETRKRQYVYQPPEDLGMMQIEDMDDVLREMSEQIFVYMPEEESVNRSFINLYTEYREKILLQKDDMELLGVYEEIKSKSNLRDKLNFIKGKIQQDQEQFHVLYKGGNKEVRKALEYLYQHYAEDISLSVIAESVGLSENYFSNLFKQETGENLVTFINRVRIENAMKLLKNQSMKVYEVAEAVGYHNATYLSTMFKKVTGMSISDYKNRK